jgi:hypothetical protein
LNCSLSWELHQLELLDDDINAGSHCANESVRNVRYFAHDVASYIFGRHERVVNFHSDVHRGDDLAHAMNPERGRSPSVGESELRGTMNRVLARDGEARKKVGVKSALRGYAQLAD